MIGRTGGTGPASGGHRDIDSTGSACWGSGDNLCSGVTGNGRGITAELDRCSAAQIGAVNGNTGATCSSAGVRGDTGYGGTGDISELISGAGRAGPASGGYGDIDGTGSACWGSGTEMQGFSRYALASAMRLLLKGLPDPTNIFCGIVIPAVRCATGLANPLPILEVSCLLIVPHSLQVLLVGSNRGILITFRPASSALSESNLKNLPQLASLIDLAR